MPAPGAFDPYLKWLAIPLGEQPPNYYRLLGIPLLEEDPEVVEAAAEQRTGFLRKHQSGPHGTEAGRLLNEVANARLCLLNPRKKATYDAQLEAAIGTPLGESAGAHDAESISTSARLRSLPPTWIATGVLVVVVLGVAVWTGASSANRPARGATKTAILEPGESRNKTSGRAASAKTAGAGIQRDVDRRPEESISELSSKNEPKSAKATDSASDKLAMNEPPARSAKDSESSGSTFRAPEGALVVEEDVPTEKNSNPTSSQPEKENSPASQGSRPDSKNDSKPSSDASPGNSDKPAEEIADPKLQAAVTLLEKTSDIAKSKLFKTLRSKLAECKEPPKRQKPLSPPLMAELEKLLAACDRKEIPPIRVQGTVSWSGHDYVYVNSDFTWNTAREICEAMGGHLVTLNTGAESSYIESTFLRPNDKPAWIGGSDAAEEGKWSWVTGEPWNFWAHINDDFGAAHAITWWRDLGYHDFLGDKRQAYVCEWESTASEDLIALGSDTRIFQAVLEAYHQARVNRLVQREKLFKAVHDAAERLEKNGGSAQVRGLYEKFEFEVPPPQRFQHKKSEYFLFREARTWHEAEAHCERMGGHLVILDAVGEPELVLAEALKNSISIWLGCSDERQEGVWRWINGTPMKMKLQTDNWGGDQHAGWAYVKNNKVTLLDQNAGVRSAYICEWELE
jgi:hypothetical protein